MAFTLTSVNVPTVLENGGHPIELTGVFELGNPYVVYIGQSASILDHPCHSGNTDQGNSVYPYDATTIKCYTPRLFPNIAYAITVQDTLSLQTKTIYDVITAIYRQYYSTVFSIRKLYPHFYKTGHRRIDNVPPVS